MRIAFVALAGALLLAGCARREPPTWDAAGASLSAVALVVPPPSPAAPKGDASMDGSGAGSNEDAGALPQTHDEPDASGAAFEVRVRALWDAIAHDEPERAMPFFFPLAAYQQVKGIANPAADWQRRLVAAYARDIHALHEKLGEGAANARLVALDVPKTRARWVNPGEEYNKLGYFRVFGTKLRYEVDGKAGAFDVKSLISWRGEWYVVHLSAIK